MTQPIGLKRPQSTTGCKTMPSPHEIREARHRAGLTQSQAAALVGVTLRSWQYWEAGERNVEARAWELFLIKSGGDNGRKRH
jgi:DNA (cytosine-5)-methyltransferase 1